MKKIIAFVLLSTASALANSYNCNLVGMGPTINGKLTFEVFADTTVKVVVDSTKTQTALWDGEYVGEKFPNKNAMNPNFTAYYKMNDHNLKRGLCATAPYNGYQPMEIQNTLLNGGQQGSIKIHCRDDYQVYHCHQ